jgi:hypothetical protein
MSALEEIASIARNYLRDFPKFFQTSFTVGGRTFELGHPNIDAPSMWIAYVPSGGTGACSMSTSAYSLDERNGLLRISSPPPQGSTLLVEGYYYDWILPSDLDFYSQIALNMHTHNLDTPPSSMSTAVIDVIGISALVEALWALTTEFSRDIDVMTSESIHIPASQRFRMVQSMLQFWMGEYEKKAKALNIGLERIEVFNLRRVSRTTNRLVPVFKDREVGDFDPIERVWPNIGSGKIDVETPPDDNRYDVYVDSYPSTGSVTPMDGYLY